MRTLLFASLLAKAVLASVLLGLDESEVCGVLKSVEWHCKTLKDCQGGSKAKQKGWTPAVCSYKGGEEIICCPSAEGHFPSPQTVPGVAGGEGGGNSSAEVQQLAWGGSWDRVPSGGWNLPQRPPSTQRTLTATKEQPVRSVRPLSAAGQPVPASTAATVPAANRTNTSLLPNRYSTEAAYTKAEEMCAEYRRYMWERVHPHLLTPKNESVKIPLCAKDKLVGFGGIDAHPFEFPHMALIGHGKENDIHYGCGGSLISERYILSAAHCRIVQGRVASWAVLGDTDLSTDMDVPKEEVVTVRIVESFVHPEFDSTKNWYSDLALFRLEKDLKLGKYIRPACLNTRRDRKEKWLTTTGWGLTKPYSPFGADSDGRAGANILQKLEMNVIPLAECNRTYSTLSGRELARLPEVIRPEGMMCAGGVPGRAICNGDSGGPLQAITRPCMYDIFGIASFGIGCKSSYPGVYTSVVDYVPWIVNIVWG